MPVEISKKKLKKNEKGTLIVKLYLEFESVYPTRLENVDETIKESPNGYTQVILSMYLALFNFLRKKRKIGFREIIQFDRLTKTSLSWYKSCNREGLSFLEPHKKKSREAAQRTP